MNTEQTALLMEAEDGASLWHDAWLRLKKNRAQSRVAWCLS